MTKSLPTSPARRRAPVRLRLAALSLLLVAAGAVANGAYQRDGRAVAFVCDGGARFSVEFHREHVRLRSGTGVFALTRDTGGEAEERRYTDGQTVFWTNGQRAGLESIGLEGGDNCQPDGRDA